MSEIPSWMTTVGFTSFKWLKSHYFSLLQSSFGSVTFTGKLSYCKAPTSFHFNWLLFTFFSFIVNLFFLLSWIFYQQIIKIITVHLHHNISDSTAIIMTCQRWNNYKLYVVAVVPAVAVVAVVPVVAVVSVVPAVAVVAVVPVVALVPVVAVVAAAALVAVVAVAAVVLVVAVVACRCCRSCSSCSSCINYTQLRQRFHVNNKTWKFTSSTKIISARHLVASTGFPSKRNKNSNPFSSRPNWWRTCCLPESFSASFIASDRITISNVSFLCVRILQSKFVQDFRSTS